MSIELDNVASGYSTGVINSNFKKLEQYINDMLLNRDGLGEGQPNQMELDLDMNGNSILNANTDLTNSNSLITVGGADERYVNVTGDTLQGLLDMAGNALYVRKAVAGNEPARKDELDTTISNYQSADANLQTQISGGAPLEASAFSPISWHDQVVENSVTIPENKNAWSFGPTMSVAPGQSVTVSNGSFWTIANGEVRV